MALLRASAGLYGEVCPTGSKGRDDSVVDVAGALTLREQVDSDRCAGTRNTLRPSRGPTRPKRRNPDDWSVALDAAPGAGA